MKPLAFFGVLFCCLFVSASAVSAASCNVSLSSSTLIYGSPVTVSYTGSDPSGKPTDLYLVRWRDGDEIDPPISIPEVINNRVAYYKAAQCGANQSCQYTSPSDLPPGKYFAYCSILSTPVYCSGNPFCTYENLGGKINCTAQNFSSCSGNDRVLFSVQPSSLSSIGFTTSLPTGLNLQFTSQGNRQVASLNGTWYIRPDRGPATYQPIKVPNFWRRWNINSIWQSANPFSDVFRNAADIRENMANPYPTWVGTVQYTTKFTLPANFQGKTLRLNFGAVSARAEVFVNGHLVGSHLGIFDPFEFEIQPYALFGQENVLTVRVTDSSPYEDPISTLPVPYQRTREQGGIWQGVSLTVVTPSHISAMRVQTPNLTTAQITADLTNNEATAQVYTLAADLFNSAGTVVNHTDFNNPLSFAADQTTAIPLTISGLTTVRPWSPENPNLYTLTVYLKKNGTVVDQVSKKIGFRTFVVSADGKKFLLNGRPYFIKGVNTININIGNPLLRDPALIASFAQKVKDTSANAVRILISPPDDIILNEMDKVGLLVLTDFPIFNTSTPSVVTEFRKEVASWMLAAYSHPSLVMYSIGNENILFAVGNDAMRNFFSDMVQYFKTNIDNTRVYLSDAGCLTYTTFNGSTFAGNAADICGDDTDVTDSHWYYFWYVYNSQNPFLAVPITGTNTLADLGSGLDRVLGLPSTKPHIFTEYGGAYTDDFQGNMGVVIGGNDPLGKPVSDSDLSIKYLGSNPARPTDALNYQAKVINDTIPVYFSKRVGSRLAGIFYNEFDHIVYNLSNFDWNRVKQFMIAAYNPCLPSLPCITDATWQNHTTLESKPAYDALKTQYSAVSPYFDTTCSLQMASGTLIEGTSQSITYWGQNAAGQTVRLYLESWPAGAAISPVPVNTTPIVNTRTYYQLGTCSADGGKCTVNTPNNLPAGVYYINCNGVDPLNTTCTGNPFCDHENLGGTDACPGFVSCSSADNARLTVAPFGDITGDGQLTAADQKEALLKYSLTGSAGFIVADLVRDGRINVLDYASTLP